MSEEGRQRHGVHQVIQGEGHQIAGNDIHNHTHVGAHPPSADSPYLQPCKICAWPISAMNPVMCGNCGHNYAQDRAIAAERDRRQYERFVIGSIVATGAVVMAAAATSNRTSLDFLDALAVCGFMAIAAWGGWCGLRAWCSVKWQTLKRRWKNGAS